MTIKTLLLTLTFTSILINSSSYAHEGGSVGGVAYVYQEVAKQCIQKANFVKSCDGEEEDLCFYNLDISSAITVIVYHQQNYEYKCSELFPYVRGLFFPPSQEGSHEKFIEHIKKIRSYSL